VTHVCRSRYKAPWYPAITPAHSRMWRAVQFNLKPSLADNARATTHPFRYTDNAKLYADGVERSLSLPYQVFEDQRSGETLGKLQKARNDVERFITAFVNVLFTATVGVIFVTIYALRVYWVIAPV
jgi:hypothetical protein